MPKLNLQERAVDEADLDLREAIDTAMLRVATEEGRNIEDVWDMVELMISGEFEMVH